MTRDPSQSLYEQVGQRAADAGVFDQVEPSDTALLCHAKEVETEAIYMVRVEQPDAARIFVGLHTPDRWLSESIEADALHRGDKFEDLIDEELADLGGEEPELTVEHFRDDQKVFVFRTAVPIDSPDTLTDEATVDRVAKLLLAYEAAFRELGDMSPGDELV